MRVIPNGSSVKLPGGFRELVGMMPPQAIMDEVHYENTLEMIDRLTWLRMCPGPGYLYRHDPEAYQRTTRRHQTGSLPGSGRG